ncbi:unnamed protein product [Albugo candida]|nr:unnamed protein product [Albugo candida]|eukprot:CCI44442.1 unnamed protein product [Albugo candida]
MIHAFLFLSRGVRDHDDHGPAFQGHMNRINSIANTKITVFHTFHREVEAYRLHWWQCDVRIQGKLYYQYSFEYGQGNCRTKKPYFGLVKRSINRPPSKRDTWWAEHQRSCGGSFIKIKEPVDYKKKKIRKATSAKKPTKSSDITSYFPNKDKDVAKNLINTPSVDDITQGISLQADRKIVVIDLTDKG